MARILRKVAAKDITANVRFCMRKEATFVIDDIASCSLLNKVAFVDRIRRCQGHTHSLCVCLAPC